MTDNTEEEDGLDNEETQTPQEPSKTDEQESNPVQETHDALSKHFEQMKSRNWDSATYDSLRRNAESAREQIEGLNRAITEATPKGPADETMRNDRADMENATQELQGGAEPTDVYGRYATVSTTPPDPTKSQKMTHDRYNVSERGNNFSVEYNLTDRNTGGIAWATNNPNHTVPATANEQNYSYNEKTVGNNTIVTTSHVMTGTRTADSENIHLGNTNTFTYQSTIENSYVYDENKNLKSTKTHRETEGTYRSRLDSATTTHKGGNICNYTKVKEDTTISTKPDGTDFSHYEMDQNGKPVQILTAGLYPQRYNDGYGTLPKEYYKKIDGNKYTYTQRSLDKNGENLYSGYTADIVGQFELLPDTEQMHNERPMEPKEAEKQFNKLQKETNKQIKELTGANSMGEYSNQLGTSQKPHNLSAHFYENSNANDAAQALQSNAELNAQYANTPTVQMNVNGTETVIPSPAQTETPSQPQTQTETASPAQTPPNVLLIKQNQGR